MSIKYLSSPRSIAVVKKLYNPYGPYGLNRASVPVQASTLPYLYLLLITCKIWVRMNAVFIVKEAINEILYICRTMANVHFGFIKFLFGSRHIQVIPTYSR